MGNTGRNSVTHVHHDLQIKVDIDLMCYFVFVFLNKFKRLHFEKKYKGKYK